jgi:hypothetical protein
VYRGMTSSGLDLLTPGGGIADMRELGVIYIRSGGIIATGRQYHKKCTEEAGSDYRRLSLGSAEKHKQRYIFRRSPELRYHGKHDGKALTTQIVLNDEVAKNDLVLWLPNCLQELAQVRKLLTQRSRLPIVQTRDKISTLYFLGLGGY